MNTNQVYYDDPYIFNASSSGVEIYDSSLDTNSYIAYILYEGGINCTTKIGESNLLLATASSGILSFDITNISGTVSTPENLSSYLSGYKQYPNITDNDVKCIHSSGDYLCVATASGIDHFNFGSSDSYTKSSMVMSSPIIGHTYEYGAYVFAGYDGSNEIQDTDEYDPDTWSSKTNISSPARRNFSTTTISDKGYVFGGHDGSGSIRDTDEYDPDSWTSKTDIPTPARRNFSSVTISDKGYIFGGYDDSVEIRDTDEYNPDTWTSKTNIPSPARRSHASSTISDKGYIFGGYDGSELQDTDEYSPDTWTSKTGMPSPARRQMPASTVSDKGYVFGGYSGSSTLKDTDEYNPDTWASKTDMPSPSRRLFPSSSLTNKGYIFGGYDGSELQDTDEYSPDTWTSKTGMPSPARRNFDATSISVSYTDILKEFSNCFQTSKGTFYYLVKASNTDGAFECNTVYTHQCDWLENEVGYTYETTGSGILPADVDINDFYVVENNPNLLFFATTSGVVLIEENPGVENNARYKNYSPTISGGKLLGTSLNFIAVYPESDSTFYNTKFACVSYGSGSGMNVVEDDEVRLFWPSTVSGTGNTIKENALDLTSVR